MFSITGSSRMRSKYKAVRASAASAPEVDGSAVCTGGMTQPPGMAAARSSSLIKGMKKRYGIPCDARSIARRFDQQLAEPDLRRFARCAAVPCHRYGRREIDRQRGDLDRGRGGDFPGGALWYRGHEIGCCERHRQRQIGRDEQRDAALQPEIRKGAVDGTAGVPAGRDEDMVEGCICLDRQRLRGERMAAASDYHEGVAQQHDRI